MRIPCLWRRIAGHRVDVPRAVEMVSVMGDTAAIAAFVSAGVALTVGVLNPLISNKTADRRLREQLAHEEKRLREQLAHERSVRRREELRDLIYGAARALTSAHRALEEVSDMWRDGVPWADERRIAASRTQWDRIEDVRQARALLAIRFEQGDPIFFRFCGCAKGSERLSRPAQSDTSTARASQRSLPTVCAVSRSMREGSGSRRAECSSRLIRRLLDLAFRADAPRCASMRLGHCCVGRPTGPSAAPFA
jgi:hypothetical protein